MRRHELGVFERAASLKVGRDSGGPEGVAADLDLHAELGRAALDHAPSVYPVHCRLRKRAGAADCGAEQGALGVPDHVGGTEVFIKEGFELVMGRHFVALAAFFMEADPPALAVGRYVTLKSHLQNCSGAMNFPPG
jgi:hypothetical protein